MGRKSSGKWRVQKDELCIDRGKDDGDCYQVWLSGKKVELRREGSTLPREGILQSKALVNDCSVHDDLRTAKSNELDEIRVFGGRFKQPTNGGQNGKAKSGTCYSVWTSDAGGQL